eukprot:s1864_g23.t1
MDEDPLMPVGACPKPCASPNPEEPKVPAFMPPRAKRRLPPGPYAKGASAGDGTGPRPLPKSLGPPPAKASSSAEPAHYNGPPVKVEPGAAGRGAGRGVAPLATAPTMPKVSETERFAGAFYSLNLSTLEGAASRWASRCAANGPGGEESEESWWCCSGELIERYSGRIFERCSFAELYQLHIFAEFNWRYPLAGLFDQLVGNRRGRAEASRGAGGASHAEEWLPRESGWSTGRATG